MSPCPSPHLLALLFFVQLCRSVASVFFAKRCTAALLVFSSFVAKNLSLRSGAERLFVSLVISVVAGRRWYRGCSPFGRRIRALLPSTRFLTPQEV